jgi:hypothetical protein
MPRSTKICAGAIGWPPRLESALSMAICTVEIAIARYLAVDAGPDNSFTFDGRKPALLSSKFGKQRLTYSPAANPNSSF